MTDVDNRRAQCCPMDTYDTDSAGDLRAVCTCGDDCSCMCLGCICEAWGDDDLTGQEAGATETAAETMRGDS